MGKALERIKNTQKRINNLDFDAHWYRRVFHTFGASFIAYYMLPDLEWVNILKTLIPVFLLIFIITLESLRISGKISGDHFFGLRMYEKKRVGSYLYFGIAVFMLLLFFPQQIAIPCILCACIADPFMGEARLRLGKRNALMVGFLTCMFFFAVTWYKADPLVFLTGVFMGAAGAVVGENVKLKWVDDDFLIQILPAMLLLVVWLVAGYAGLALPGEIVRQWVLGG
jgi:dolichol kinase